MLLFICNVKKIKGFTPKKSDIDGACKQEALLQDGK